MASPAVDGELLRSLRHRIAKIEGVLPERLEEASARDTQAVSENVIPTRVPRLDMALGGGMPKTGLTEIHGAATRDAGAASGFALAISRMLALNGEILLWVGTADVFRETGYPYVLGPASGFGLAAESFLIAETPAISDALWIAEEAVHVEAFGAILLEVRGSAAKIDLTATRRLHRRGLSARKPIFLIRHAAEEALPTAAPLRLVIRTAPAGLRRTMNGYLEGSIGPPAFHLTISKSRTATPAEFTLEWNNDAAIFQDRSEQAYPVGLVSSSAGRASASPKAWPRVAFGASKAGGTARFQRARG